MKNKLFIQLLFPLIIVGFVHAQKTKMVLKYHDGTVKSGYGKLASEKTIKFKTSKKAKAKKMAYKDLKGIKEIKYYTTDAIKIYEFVPIGDDKVKLLQRTVKGKVNLYKRVRVTGGTYMPMAGPNGMAGGGMWTGTNTIKNFYVQRNGEKIATHLGSDQLFTKSFIKAMSEYVKDCPELVKKIKSKKLRKSDVIEIVEYYNEDCE